MVFVNDVAGVNGLPAWMYHAAADANAMTFVDIVFPAFLIIVGMSIPLAISRRFEKGESVWQVIQYILIRTTGLIVLGIFMVNSEEMNREANLIPASWWNVLFYLSAIAVWNQYPKDGRKFIRWSLQITGVIVLIVLALLFRKGESGALTGMTPSWWGILGLIGWAYFLATMVYLAVKNNVPVIIAIFSLFMIVAGLKWIGGQSGHLVHAGLVLAGIIITLLLQSKNPKSTVKTHLQWILIIGACCFLAGYFLKPLYGVSKIYATPSWALYSIGWCSLIFAFIHWLVEIRGISKWANFLKPAGTNPLLTYILPYIWYAVAGFTIWPAVFNQGFPGVLRSVVFSLFILWVAGVLTRYQIRLRL